MVDNNPNRILEILVKAKKVSNILIRKNCLNCIIKIEDDSGEELEYTVTFNKDEISARNNTTGVFLKDYGYNRDIFLKAIANYKNLLDIRNPVNNKYNFNILNIIFDKANHKDNNFSSDKYIDDFIVFNNRNDFINRNNYFLFLKIACEGGNYQLFEYLRYTYPEYFQNLNEEEQSVLSGSACFGGNPEIVHSLEENNFIFDYNALQGAIAGKNFNIFKYLTIDACTVDINSKGRFGETILHYAILSHCYDYPLTNYPEALGFLISNSNNKNDDRKPKPTIIEYLLSWPGIDINAQANGGYTILHLAIKRGDRELIDYLISQPNININLRDKDGDSLLHYFIAKKDINMIKNLISDPNTDINIKNGEGYTPLKLFILDNNFEMVEKLIYNPNIDVNIKDNSGATALHIAVWNGNEDIVRLVLFDPEIDINAQDQYGDTPLSDAILKGNFTIAKILLSMDGIDVNKKSHMSNTALHCAIIKNDSEIIELLLKKNNIDVNVINQNKESPLTIAARIYRDDFTIPKLLIEKGAKINDSENDRNPPLRSAIFSKNKEMVNFLEENGADFDIPIRKYGTPCKYSIFMEAITEDRKDVIKFILDNCIDKIDINKPYYHDHTALTEAISVGNIELVKLLVDKYGAKITDNDIDVAENKEKEYNDYDIYRPYDMSLSVDMEEEELKNERIEKNKKEIAKILKQYKIKQSMKQTIELIVPEQQVNGIKK